MTTTPFPFDVRFQRGVLRLAMIDDEFAIRAFQYVDAAMFTDRALGWLFTTMQRYHVTYGQRCTELPLRDALRYAEPEHVIAYHAEIDAVVALGEVPEADYVKRELREFIRRAHFARAHAESASAYNAGRMTEAYDLTMRALDKIREVDFDTVDRQWFFEELAARQKVRHADALAKHSRCFTTGIPDIDTITDGGAQRGEVWLVFAYAKVGKTTWLINEGAQAAQMHGARVAHFALEGKGKQIADRYETYFSGSLYSDVKRGDINAKVYRDLLDEYARLKQCLVIRTLNEWDTTVLDIESEVKLLRATGFVPDVLVVDYLDLLRARNGKGMSETEQQVEAARDLKKLTNRLDVLTWTASQARRPKEGAEDEEHILRASQIADAYAKIRIVDFVGSLNATNEERDRGEVRFFGELYRDGPMGRCWKMQCDFARMKLGISMTELSLEEAAPTKKRRGKRDDD